MGKARWGAQAGYGGGACPASGVREAANQKGNMNKRVMLRNVTRLRNVKPIWKKRGTRHPVSGHGMA